MDPIILTAIAIIVIVLLLRIFFGVAKFFLKIGVIIVLAIIIWRVLVMRG
jgi:hypothetical protein